MFERFTRHARAVVHAAVEHSERAGARTVDSEHVLLALLDRQGSRASFALSALLPPEGRASVRQALAESRRLGGLSRADTDALADLGIDVHRIVDRVEEAHGAGALSGTGGGDSGGSGGEKGGGGLNRRPFSRDARNLLERTLRIALAHRELSRADGRVGLRRRGSGIGDEHLLLALTSAPGVPAEVLADHGVTYDSVTRVLYGTGEATAS